MNRSSKELSFRMHAPDEQTLALARILEHGTWDEVQLYRSINNISSTRRRGVPLAGCFEANRPSFFRSSPTNRRAICKDILHFPARVLVIVRWQWLVQESDPDPGHGSACLVGRPRDQLLARGLVQTYGGRVPVRSALRSHASLEGHTPLTFAGHTIACAESNKVRWVSHCRDLVQLPEAA
jgi:hypothetical protein